MICACPCKREFEAKRKNQIYFEAACRYREQNRRAPVKRSNVSGIGSGDGRSEPQQARYSVVTKATGSAVAQPSDSPQFLTPGEISELQSIDAIVCREKLLTSREVAGILGVSVETLHSWRRTKFKGAPRFVRLAGPRVRYRLRDLRDWLDRLGETVRERA
jgi:predicted DNA-binding transcriptional regulator AlpA